MSSSRLSINRRDFLRLTASGIAVAGVAGTAPAVLRAEAAAGAVPAPGRTGAPKNIIFMVSDGMSMGVPSIAEPFSRLVRGSGTSLGELLRLPETSIGFFDTRSLNSMVTDSAAASSAWGSGTRVFNGALNMLPDGTKLTPLAHLVKDSGRRVGLVSTARITHATPAGFAVNQPRRDDEDDIATQFVGVVDVLLGGGLKHFDPAKRKDKRDLLAEYTAKGYTVWKQKGPWVEGKDAPEKVLGLFDDSHVPYTVDHLNSDKMKASVPTLAEMTRVALASLGKSEKGFLLQVEGARVDHAAHGNDAAAIIWDQIAFDDALAVVLEFQQAHPDTLVVVTSDHGNSNPGLNGVGSEYKDSTACFEQLAKAKASLDVVADAVRTASGTAAPDPVMIRDVIRRHLGIELGNEEAETLLMAFAGKPQGPINKLQRNLAGVYGEVLGNHNGVGWTATTHTSDDTLIAAIGPGRERFAGRHLNVEGFRAMTELFGITHTNPSMTLDEAKKFLSYAPRIRQDDWA